MTKTLAGKKREIVISTLKEIADTAGLSPVDKGRFVKFAIAWFNFNGKKLWADTRYGIEWAERFLKKKEYYLADTDRIYLLIKVDGLTSARSRLEKQLVFWGGHDRKGAREKAQALHSSGRLLPFRPGDKK